MPTKNPRLSVVLSPALAATLAAIAEETGDSASSVARNVLEQTQPAFERMLQLVRAAKAAQGQIGAGVSSALDRVVDDLEATVKQADARAGRAHRDLVQLAEEVKGRRRRTVPRASGAPSAAAAELTPVPVTRGSGRSGGGKSKGSPVVSKSKGVRRVRAL